jgi:hypothetical protein
MLRFVRNNAAKKKNKGQSFVELALVLTVILFLLAAVVEFGNLLNQYINVVDAARYAARQASTDDLSDMTAFLTVIPDYVDKGLTPIKLNPAKDDIIISVYSIQSGGSIVRLVTSRKYSHATTKFTTSIIGARLDSTAPNTGVVVIEIFYGYPQILKLPIFTSVFPDPIPVYAYSIMPLTAAEPTPTP